MSQTTSSGPTDNDPVDCQDAVIRDATDPLTSNATSNSQIDNGKPADNSAIPSQQTIQNEAELIDEMRNFDNLLKMLSVYRDNPDLRGNPNDRHIEEIAKILSNFIGDDPDNFLRDSDEEEEAAVQVNGESKEEPDNTSDSKQEPPHVDENVPSQAR